MRPEQIRVLCAPTMPLEHTVSLVRELIRADRHLDIQIADLILGQSGAPPLDRGSTLRALEILDQVTVGPRLVRLIGQLLEHADPHIRSKAALVAGRRVEGWAWIHARLASAEPRVRANVLEALWASWHTTGAALFARYSRDADNRVAGNALYGLYLRDDPAAIPSVLRMASHSDPRFRGTAAWLMGKMGQPRFVDALQSMLYDEDRHVKGIALQALVRINRRVSARNPGGRLMIAGGGHAPH